MSTVDVLAAELAEGTYEAAELTAGLLRGLIDRGESFIFETVLSDPIGEEVQQLAGYVEHGYEVVLNFIRIDNVQTSIERVSI